MKLKITALILVLIMALGLMVGCNGKDASDTTGDNKIDVELILVLEDKTEKTHNLKVTEGSNLRDALLEAGLIDEANHSALFVETIDGYTASVAEGYTWMVTDANDEQIMGFFEEIILEDGQTIKLVHYLVPNFD